MNLRVPGPTPVPPEVLAAVGQPMINHRGPEFAALGQAIDRKLKRFFQTEGDILILTGSGTGGLEAAVANTISPGEPVLVVTIGAFGDRLAEICRVFGADVRLLAFPWGETADPDALHRALAANPAVTTVFMTHNETSTGVTNPLRELAAVAKAHDKLLVVDAISSLGSIDLPVDAWQCDVVVTGSQKGWYTPPGLTMVSVSAAGWRANARARAPRFYWDFAIARKWAEKGQTPWTPAVSLFYGLAKGLELLEREGFANVLARHARVGEFTRRGIAALGLELFPRDLRFASNTVTTVRAPAGLDVKKLLGLLRTEYGVVLAGGQGKLDGQVFRIGHLGAVQQSDIQQALDALKLALPAVGFSRPGIG